MKKKSAKGKESQAEKEKRIQKLQEQVPWEWDDLRDTTDAIDPCGIPRPGSDREWLKRQAEYEDTGTF